MEIQVIESTVTPFSCSVRVGNTYLEFDTVHDTFRCVGRYSYGRDRPNVEKADFLEARRQGLCATASKKNQARFPDRMETFIVTEEAVRRARRWGYETLKGKTVYDHEAVTNWLVASGRWTREREKEMRSLAVRMNIEKRTPRQAELKI